MTIDAGKLLNQFMNSGMATGLAAGVLGGALARKAGLGDVANIGGLALVGTLAYQAWQKHNEGQNQLPPGQRTAGIGGTIGGVLSNMPGVGDFMQGGGQRQAQGQGGFATGPMYDAPQQQLQQQNQLGSAVLIAMIAAAKADGEVDRAESQKIMGQMEQAGLTGEEKSFLLAEMARPLNIEDVAQHASSPEVAAQLYTASAIVIDQVNERERNYLAMLAQRLNLPQGFVQQLHAELAR
jgi:uncharacterized membrane protein YebE (DUF533 family)